jgi:dynactin complex subunit
MNIKRFSNPPDYYLQQLKNYQTELEKIRDELTKEKIPPPLINRVKQLHSTITEAIKARENGGPPPVPPLEHDF